MAPATSQTVEMAVKRSQEILAYQHPRDVEHGIILAWAAMWVAEHKKPEGWPEPLTPTWVNKNSDKFFITAAHGVAVDGRVLSDGGSMLAFVGCNQKPTVVKSLAKVWSAIGAPAGDGLGDAYMALHHG